MWLTDRRSGLTKACVTCHLLLTQHIVRYRTKHSVDMIAFNLHENFVRWFNYPGFRWRNWEQSVKMLSEVSQLENVRIQIGIQVIWYQNPCFNHSSMCLPQASCFNSFLLVFSRGLSGFPPDVRIGHFLDFLLFSSVPFPALPEPTRRMKQSPKSR